MNSNYLFIISAIGLVILLGMARRCHGTSIGAPGKRISQPNQTQSCQCGVNQEFKGRIIGGEKAEEAEFPWQALMLNGFAPHCGASLINDRYVLTAAHCYKGFGPMVKKEDVVFLLGRNRLVDFEFPIQIWIRKPIKIILHKRYHPGTFVNDIALAKLNKPFESYNTHLRPVCLPYQKVNVTDMSGTVYGWGKVNETRTFVSSLMKTTVEIFPREACKKKLLRKLPGFDVRAMFCASSNNSDACQGDSGGPLTLELEKHKHIQIGVVSHGIGCADQLYPGVYTRVEKFIKWIMFHTRDAIYCDK